MTRLLQQIEKKNRKKNKDVVRQITHTYIPLIQRVESEVWSGNISELRFRVFFKKKQVVSSSLNNLFKKHIQEEYKSSTSLPEEEYPWQSSVVVVVY